MRRPNDLVSCWQRYDWRESFFAPGLAILQALTTEGRTASGAGTTREAAFQRCLGETAELHALAARGGRARRRFHPQRDGLAAHPDPECARRAAALEAFERRAVARWWRGEDGARAVSTNWLSDQGLEAKLSAARDGAALKRRTGWWQTGPVGGPCVLICRSMSQEGQDPILGFAADPDPRRAAAKATREMLLMELNLMDLFAARTAGQKADVRQVQEQVSVYARRCPGLLPPSPSSIPGRTDGAQLERTLTDWLGAKVTHQEITPADGPISVWLCQAEGAPPVFDPETGQPFL
jgi:YcaO cyclodehydratase, ATP-ad Mg2+-binding